MAQKHDEILYKYKKHMKVGNIFTNWFYELTSTSTVWIEELTLKSDSTYIWHHYGGHSTTDLELTGTWNVKADTLLLKADLEGNDAKYIMKGNKLFYPLSQEKKNWVMKLY